MKIFLKISFILILFSACSAKEETKVIYLVRHAEKEMSDNSNPDLSVEGVMRSVDLKSWFKDKAIDSIISTSTDRTMNTVQPLAEARNLKIGIYNAKKDQATIVENYKAGEIEADTILICGHSNTLLEQIEAFDASRPQESIGEFEYDKIFELQLPERKVVVHQYGSVYEQ